MRRREEEDKPHKNQKRARKVTVEVREAPGKPLKRIDGAVKAERAYVGGTEYAVLQVGHKLVEIPAATIVGWFPH